LATVDAALWSGFSWLVAAELLVIGVGGSGVRQRFLAML
jgi:hypothetical protein